ncbi:sigma-E factor negative regulatory protein [Microbulbifer aggregans]|uniref:sigma-E factor negative regulatory protein n=1 Tax=Microbulbifer aggregans TaxID=1769779 RepID=UPI001CFC53B5|nr:sigma-E factor negative regulatory protein [Microbulbifer aggregans]
MSHGKHQQRLNESLSAMMDGEASELEIQRLLKESSAGGGADDLGQRWSRYQLAASVMRGEQVAPVDLGLAASISVAIDEEPAHHVQPDVAANDAGARSRWWRPLSRGAVAATVAFAAVLGVQQIQQPVTSGGELVAEVERPVQQPVQSAPRPSGFYVPALNTRSVSTMPLVTPEQRGVAGQQNLPAQLVPSADLMRHLNRVMVEHSEQAAQMGSQGMVPFARATYGEQPPE